MYNSYVTFIYSIDNTTEKDILLQSTPVCEKCVILISFECSKSTLTVNALSLVQNGLICYSFVNLPKAAKGLLGFLSF